MKNPPSTVQLHPMLMPVLCDTGNIFQAWDTWQKMGAKKMGAYFYHDDMWFIIPKLDIHQSAKRIRYIAASGLARSFYQEFYGIYPLNGMVGYVEQELTWDPRQNVDDLLNEYYHGFYGLAWKSMQSFYELLEADYHVWLEKAGKPHPHGPDISSIVDNRTLNQFAVLSESTAEKAQLALDAAWVAAKDEPLVRERISVVKTLFDFAVPGSQMFGARERLHNANIQSVSDADEIMADARKAVDSSLALAAYKTDVMEKSEAKSYADHGNRDKFYNGLEKGAVLPEVLNTISVALKEVAEYLNQSIGNEKANAWWQVQLNQETREVLKNQMRVAIFDASGQKLENRVQDPGFETRGTQQLANTDEDEDGHLKYGGANVWRSGGTQMQCSLTSEEAHNGKYSFTFSQTASAGVSEPFTQPLQTGDILRMSVWVKHNAGQAKYSVQTDPRSTSGQLPRATVEVPWKPDEWQQIELLATVVPGTVRMNFWVFVKGQDPEARIWVDDFFIGKYPDLE